MHLKSGLIRQVAFSRSGLITGELLWPYNRGGLSWGGILRSILPSQCICLAFGKSGLIRGGLLCSTSRNYSSYPQRKCHGNYLFFIIYLHYDGCYCYLRILTYLQINWLVDPRKTLANISTLSFHCQPFGTGLTIKKLSSRNFILIFKKSSNQNTVSNKYNVLIGLFCSTSTKIGLKCFNNIRPEFHSLENLMTYLHYKCCCFCCLAVHNGAAMAWGTLSTVICSSRHSEAW
jgi:hypothetical protein